MAVLSGISGRFQWNVHAVPDEIIKTVHGYFDQDLIDLVDQFDDMQNKPDREPEGPYVSH